MYDRFDFLAFRGLFADSNEHLLRALSTGENTCSSLNFPVLRDSTQTDILRLLVTQTKSWAQRKGGKNIGIGYSYGGLLMLEVINDLCTNPFDAIVLVNSVPPGDIDINWFNPFEAWARVRSVGAYWPIIKKCAHSGGPGWSQFVKRNFNNFCDYLLPPGMTEAEQKEAFAAQRSEWGVIVRAAVFERPSINWSKINCPVLIISGGQDVILSSTLKIGTKMAKVLKNAHSNGIFEVTIPGMGHYIRRLDAEEIAKTTFSFLQNCLAEDLLYT